MEFVPYYVRFGGYEMTNYMKKTKKELVDLIEDLIQERDKNRKELKMLQDKSEVFNDANRQLAEQGRVLAQVRMQLEEEKRVTLCLKSKIEEMEEDRQHFIGMVEKERESVYRQVEQAKDRGSAEIDQYKTLTTEINNRLRILEDSNAVLKENHRLLEEKNLQLQKEKDELEDQLEQAVETLNNQEKVLDTSYELFKSFVDNDSEKIILIDSSYTIRYINRTALQFLGAGMPDAFISRKIFDFFKYKEALKLKEKIDNAFLNNEKEKIKDIKFLSPVNGSIKIKLNLYRVRYKDKISLKVSIR